MRSDAKLRAQVLLMNGKTLMKNLLVALIALCAGSSLAGAVSATRIKQSETAAPVSSVYTGLSAGGCRTIKVDRESGSSTQRCGGVASYKLLVEDSDARMSVTVTSPDGRNHPLSYWQVVTPYFSSLGARAEWRVVQKDGKVVPFALIVRVNAHENAEESGKVTSYLAVAKITAQEICVTDKISPGPTANEDARRAADSSASKACLKE
jgi:hypothetical protein